MAKVRTKAQEEEDERAIAILHAKYASKRKNPYHVGENIQRSRVRKIKNGLKCFRD